MDKVHVFICTGRFTSFKSMRDFIDQTYTEDDEEEEAKPSPFMEEVGLEDYEPMCIEAIHSPQPQPLSQLLEGVSYSEQWVEKIPPGHVADAAICVLSPNTVTTPKLSSLTYVGEFEYQP